MLHSADRLDHFRIRPGDSARLPHSVEQLGDTGAQYPETWDVVSFGGIVEVNGVRQCLRHCVQIRRRHDGLTTYLASHWWALHAATFYGRGTRWYPTLAYVLDRWERRGVGDPIWQRLCQLSPRLGLPVPVAPKSGRLPVSALGHLAEQLGLSHTATTHLIWYAWKTPTARVLAADGLTVEQITEQYRVSERRH